MGDADDGVCFRLLRSGVLDGRGSWRRLEKSSIERVRDDDFSLAFEKHVCPSRCMRATTRRHPIIDHRLQVTCLFPDFFPGQRWGPG